MRTAPHLPAWWLRRLRARLRTPERRLSCLEARRGLAPSPQTAPTTLRLLRSHPQVQLLFKEDLGTGGRGGYFDTFGIIRDIMQNHLLQAFMWLAMEPPSSMTGDAITAAKCELLRSVKTLALDPSECFLGQFAAHGDDSGYLDDPTVPAGSKCPTFASLVLSVDTPRWRGVPFLFTAGKGMDERVCELRVRTAGGKCRLRCLTTAPHLPPWTF